MFPISVLVLFQLIRFCPLMVPEQSLGGFLVYCKGVPCLVFIHQHMFLSQRLSLWCQLFMARPPLEVRKSPKAYRVVPDFLHLSAPQTAPDGLNKQSAQNTFDKCKKLCTHVCSSSHLHFGGVTVAAGGGGWPRSMSDTRWREALHLCMLYGFFSRILLRDKGFSNLYPLVREPHGDALKR